MRRAALVLAMLAALMGAPSSLLAAPPNQLSSPSASPTSGDVLTTFVLSVRYTSTGGNPAQAVVAETGAVWVELSLVSGTATDGLWRGSTLLPVGTWTVTFRAAVNQGPQPSFAGPTLNVLAAPGPAPPLSSPNVRPVSTEAQPTSTPAVNPQASASSASATPDARPAGSAQASAAPEQPTSNAEPLISRPAGTADARPLPATATVRGGADTNTAPSPADGANPTGGAPRASAGSSPRADDPPGGLTEGDPRNPSTDLFLLLGVVVSVATVTLLGTGWMLAVRSRDEPEPAAALTGRGRRSAAATRRAAELEERRSRRRAQRLPGHDPVLAALGLDADDETDAGLAPRRGTARGAPPRSRPGPRR